MGYRDDWFNDNKSDHGTSCRKVTAAATDSTTCSACANIATAPSKTACATPLPIMCATMPSAREEKFFD